MKSLIKQLKYLAIGLPVTALMAVWPHSSLMAQKDIRRLSPALQEIATPQSTPEWLDFREGANVKSESIFTTLKSSFDLSGDDDMKIIKTENDNLGYTHYRYQQYYKNIKVLYGEYLVHQTGDGFVKSVNGRLITGLNLNNKASLSEAQALNAALGFVGATKYLWQNSEMEKELKRQQKNEAATYFPKGELVYAPATEEASFKASEYKLAWAFSIYTDGGVVMAKKVIVDATTGQIIRHNDIAMNCSGGSGASAFNGTVTINTLSSGGTFVSHNDCQATDIYVYNCNGGAAVNNLYSDADNAWTNASAVQAQFGAAQTYSYYNGQHSRQSWDGASGDMIAYNNAVYGGTANNACWGCYGNNTIFGQGSTTAATDDWNTDDIMGHEFTHGVTQASANLDYNKESGALNESYSDIFGEMVESWTEGNCDYLVGADRGAIRSFITPNTYGQPDTYLGTSWYTTTSCTPGGTNDNCGVHTNSGVQNHWFYLLSEGGTGTTDFGKDFSVAAITRFKARDIAYRALTMYETSSTQYIDARAATLHAALDLYGQCSAEIIAVGDAWHAVGVESQSAQYVNDVCGAVASGDFKQAISQLTGNGCGTGNTINTGTSVTYYAARDRVILYAGFKAPVGSRFIAYLEPCSSTMYRTPGAGNGNVIMSDAERGIKPVIVPMVNVAKTPAGVTNITAITEGVTVSPNPFRSTFDVAISSKEDGKAQVSVYNSLGVKVNAKAGISISKGLNKTTFDGADMAPGVYMVEIINGDKKTIKKIVKL